MVKLKNTKTPGGVLESVRDHLLSEADRYLEEANAAPRPLDAKLLRSRRDALLLVRVQLEDTNLTNFN